jgi:hypothetical protein
MENDFEWVFKSDLGTLPQYMHISLTAVATVETGKVTEYISYYQLVMT